MPSQIADYSIILDEKKIAPQGLNGSFPWELPNSVAIDTRSIVTFTLLIRGGPARFRISINEHNVSEPFLDEGIYQLTKIVQRNVLQKGTNRFRVDMDNPENTTGAELNNVAIWWQRNI